MAIKEKLTIADVKQIVLDRFEKKDLRNFVIYIDERIFPEGTGIDIHKERYQFTSDTIMVFIDEDPGKNWGHECRYLFFNTISHKIDEVHKRFPPFLTKVPVTFQILSKPTDIPSWFLLINNNEGE